MFDTIKHRRIAVLALTFGLVCSGASAANAATAPDPTYLKTFLSQNSVPQSVQDRLVKKLLAGEIFDSLDPDARVVSTRSSVSASAYTTIDTFADGSISVNTVERAPEAGSGTVGTRSVSGCTVKSGSGYASYSGCTVEESNGLTTLRFKAAYERYSNSAQILAVSGAYVNAHYGSTTAPTLSIRRKSTSGNLEAYAQEYSHFKSYNDNSSEDLYLSLRVNSSRAWSTTY